MRRKGLVLLTIALFVSVGVFSEEGWWIGGGVLIRGGIDVDAQSTAQLEIPETIGDLSSYADRTYADGYVKKDAGTGNPASIDPSVTWYWGYDNAAQYDAGTETLVFHGTQLSGTAVSDLSDGVLAPGLEVVTGYRFRHLGSERVKVDLCFGMQLFIPPESDLTMNGQLEVIAVTDTYDVTGIAIPTAPFAGTYDGPFGPSPDIPSPTIPNIPASRMATGSGSSYSLPVKLSIDTDLQSFYFGPRFSFGLSEKIWLTVMPKLTLNHVSVKVEHSEALYDNGSQIGQYSDSYDESEWNVGMGGVAALEVQLDGGWFINVWGGYDLAPEVEAKKGDDVVTVDPSGYSAGFISGFRF